MSMYHQVHGDSMTSEMAVIENVAWEIHELNHTLKKILGVLELIATQNEGK